ncbi:uncharacterized protein J7T54_007619 [Emericellopsis cladophorae]|uniref:Pectinesterase n=1 Tax=Emericellopsis cladophorae TaxID=2686198 RepID=A0A9P9XVN2_9HYPO|nr:uncharacterized protein J7T54_007619 [Emericellopsis cladophorae]KAI6778678.1 hypothetical protein J7T54_007619 [Emericellopsis cladophorae]
MRSLFTVTALATTALAASRTSAPDGCLTVAADGTGDHTTVQAAVDALSEDDPDPQCIFIAPGTYNEQVLVADRAAARFTIYGHTEDDTTFAGNTVTITYDLSQADGLNNDQTATLRVKTPNFRLYNVHVANTYGEGSQAVALSAQSDSGYYGSIFTGFQDTVLANEGKQIYLDTQILGATDFIFGQRAAAWFERVDIRVVEKSLGYITANGRDSPDGMSYYVFDQSTISAAEGDNVPDGAYYLGRPWRPYSRVVFQNTDMSEVINADGWHDWNGASPDNVEYAEYGNTGPGAAGPRVSWADQLDAPVTIGEVLGAYKCAGWFDASYYAGQGADVGAS